MPQQCDIWKKVSPAFHAYLHMLQPADCFQISSGPNPKKVARPWCRGMCRLYVTGYRLGLVRLYLFDFAWNFNKNNYSHWTSPSLNNNLKCISNKILLLLHFWSMYSYEWVLFRSFIRSLIRSFIYSCPIVGEVLRGGKGDAPDRPVRGKSTFVRHVPEEIYCR